MQMTKKVILITQRSAVVGSEVRQQLCTDWVTFLSPFQVLVVPLPYCSDVEDYFNTMPVCGVIFTGGNDIANLNGSEPDQTLSLQRDEFEKNVLNVATSRGIPILAVCRGMQFIANELGASFVQVGGHVGSNHKVFATDEGLEKSTCLDIWKNFNPQMTVNSYHEWCVSKRDDVDENGLMLPILLSDDGHIEAFEAVIAKSLVLGIMWHPERAIGLQKKADENVLNFLFGLGQKIRTIVLCAGQGTRLRPLTDTVPKCMVKYQGFCIIDYILNSLRACGLDDICLVKGYLKDVLLRDNVRYALNEDYMQSNMVYSLFCGEREMDHDGDIIVSYSDIIYVPSIVKALCGSIEDIAVVIDKDWKNLWQARMENPLDDAETLKIGEDGRIIEIGKRAKSYDDICGQFIGLIKFSKVGMKLAQKFYHSMDRDGTYDGKNFNNMFMTSFLQSMIDAGIKVMPVWVNGGWMECDDPRDLKVDLDVSSIPMPETCMSSKADTLQVVSSYFQGGVRRRRHGYQNAHVAPMISFTVKDWHAGEDAKKQLIEQIIKLVPTNKKLIIRSSAKSEDTQQCSNAGAFLSIDSVTPTSDNICTAVEAVLKSYGVADPSDQVLVQPSLYPAEMCGVIFTVDLENRQPYHVVSFDVSGSTDSVTSGRGESILTLHRLKVAPGMTTPTGMPACNNPKIAQVIQMSEEMETLFGNSQLDIEFAFKDDKLYLLQCRPIVSKSSKDTKISEMVFREYLQKMFLKLQQQMSIQHPDLPGEHTAFSVMTDWNPAEIIGCQPRRLALSLYMHLVTNSMVAESRSALGYRNASGFPLMISLFGRPYIDLRVSFTTLVPASISDQLANKLVSYYVDCVKSDPSLHDKVEFEVILTCAHPALKLDLQNLLWFGFNEAECECIEKALISLTNKWIDAKHGMVRKELSEIEKLDTRRVSVIDSLMPTACKIHHLLEDLKRFGIQPFSKLARFGFVGKSILLGLKRIGALTSTDETAFMCSLNTVSRELGLDLRRFQNGVMSKSVFLEKYGHLRPGTYDIMSKRYDETFDSYFCVTPPQESLRSEKQSPAPFKLSDEKRVNIETALQHCGLKCSCSELFDFIRQGIEAREYSKFMFSKTLSDVLVLIQKWGQELGVSHEKLSCMPISIIQNSYLEVGHADLNAELQHAVEKYEKLHEISSQFQLPVFISEPGDVYSFISGMESPNFITKQSVQGPVQVEVPDLSLCSLDGKIVFIYNADPGWDWLFTRNIAGIVTCFGGANSHMAIRSAELNLPAVIGTGPVKFETWSKATVVAVDCSTQQVQIVN